MKVLLDTNVLVSAVLYGGKPKDIFKRVLSGEIIGITSEVLTRELVEVLRIKFGVEQGILLLLENIIKENFIVVSNPKTIKVLQDEPDNRVLEAALAGKCDYIVTGDKELLLLGKFEKTRIISTSDFLDLF